ncbi:MAG: carbohydrate-binding family 9-like protein [Armatimonadetes bacterium]|nr:carbohydrate-binding family 9-like protein [Armatimonadota bacterium]
MTWLCAIFILPAMCASADLLEDVRFSEPEPLGSGLEGVERLRFELPEAEGINVDGRLDEPVWSEPAAHLGRFRLGLSAVPARHSREAWAAWDADNLYFAVRLQREPGTELRVNTRENDNGKIWEDDEIEVFLDPFNTGTEYFQIIINSEGFLFDARHNLVLVPDPGAAGPGEMKLERVSDRKWSSELRRAVNIEDEWWTAEMAVPLRALGLAGASAGHSLGFNITSADWDTGEYTCLSPTSNWHDPLQFGVLALGRPRVEVTDLTLGNVGAGGNLLRARVRDLTGEGGSYTLVVTFTTDAGRVTSRREFTLEPDRSRRVSVRFRPWGTSSMTGDWSRMCRGSWRADIEIVGDDGRRVYMTRRVGTFAPLLTLDLSSSATFTGGRPVKVAARLGLGSSTARSAVLTARLTDERGRVMREHQIGRAGGAVMSAWLPVDDLAPGTYTLELVAGLHEHRIARATETLRVASSPWASR